MGSCPSLRRGHAVQTLCVQSLLRPVIAAFYQFKEGLQRMSEFLYYLNGKFVRPGEASLALNDLGVVRGYGIFDAWRTYGKVPFRQQDHLDRLFSSAKQIDLTMPWSRDELDAIAHETLARNGNPENVTLRMIVTGGESSNFIMPEDKPSLAVIVAAVKPYPAEMFENGAKLIVVDMDRFMPTVKSLNYMTAVMSQKKMKAVGAVEALYRNADGYISECAVSNFLIFKGDKLITPESGVLPGITRNVAMELAEDRFEVVMRPIHFDEIATADEAFITSTTKEVMPIVQVGDVTVGNGKVGERTKYMMDVFKTYAEQLCR